MKKFSLFSFVLIVFAVLCCVSCGSLISTAMIELFSTPLSSSATTVFAISLKNSSNKEDLQEFCLQLQSQNGAGYVLFFDNKFHVIASVYENKNDAELVKNKFSADFDCSVLQITIPAIEVNGNFDASKKEVIEKCLALGKTTYKQLYDISVSLDSNVISQEGAKSQCNNIFTTYVAQKANFETLFPKLENMKKNLQKGQSTLSDLICEKYASNLQTFSSLVKLSYCKILFD